MMWLSRFLVWVGSRLSAWGFRIDERIRTRAALPVGTCVRLTCVGCQFRSGHDGVWFVRQYNVDADDYRLCRDPAKEDGGDNYTYAHRNAMAIVQENAS